MTPNYNLLKRAQPLCQKTSSYRQYGLSYRFRLWIYRFFKFEQFANKQALFDEFDSVYLKFVYMGFNTIEEHFEIKKLFFEKKGINQMV